jgi:hypothetical protein
MPQASSHLPKRITLVWGRDRLELDDPIWIAKIVQSMVKERQPNEDFRVDLSWPRSRRQERIDLELVAMGCHPGHQDPEDPQAEIGYEAPEQQDSVAVEALRVFLGLEMPVALNFTSWSGRSEHRLSAVHTAFRLCWHHRKPDEPEVEWMFSGYQLYASHHIGTAHFWPYGTDSMGHIERRLLNGQWVRWGFDGASTPPPGRHWSSDTRRFILAPSGIQRIGQSDSGLSSEYKDDEFDNDVEEGMSPSQEAT